jgi:amidase
MVPNYMSALDLNFVRAKRIGYNGTTPQILEAKAALEAAGAILVERPVIDPGTLPALSGQGEQHMEIDLYYDSARARRSSRSPRRSRTTRPTSTRR